jgi:hypothetical protein
MMIRLDIIKIGAGISGAHSDIAHPEVAHAFWQAALTPLYRPSVGGEGGLLLGLGREKTTSQSGGTTSRPAIQNAPRWVNAELKDHAAGKPLVSW